MSSARDQQNRSPSRHGFTLVELLVVIGIIALLISILLPSLSKARESANTVKCLANLKSIGQALNLYSTENRGASCPAAYLDMNGSTSAGNITDSYATILIVAGYLPPQTLTSATAAPYSGASVFVCPNGLNDSIGVNFSRGGTTLPQVGKRTSGLGARCWRAVSALQPGLIADTWYGINALWGPNVTTSYFPSIALPDTAPNPPAFSYRRISTIPYPAEMVCMFDGIFYDLHYDANRLNARHGRQTQTNILFFDGHAATYNTKELPGGSGDANAPGGIGNTPYNSVAGLNAYASPKWRIDQ